MEVAPVMSLALSPASTSPRLDLLLERELAPAVVAIDLEGRYPERFLRLLGAAGGFAPAAGATRAAPQGLPQLIGTMASIGTWCGSTAFLYWCQTACARYLRLSENETLKHELLPQLLTGELLGGTGLSNPLKASSAIEPFRLRARPVADGFEVDGVLPWVSNLGPSHVFVTGCPVEGDGRLVFFLVRCGDERIRLLAEAHFAALEGTRTFGVVLRGYRVSAHDVLATPETSEAFLARIKPGMMLSQLGLAIGITRDAIALIREAARGREAVNAHLPTQAFELERSLFELERDVAVLAARIEAGAVGPAVMPEVLRLRLAGAELALHAAQAALLHQGAKGFLREARAQRRLREACFMAIVTPAVKHLRLELARLSGAVEDKTVTLLRRKA
ncbi:MAG: acyl-CoA dehydrogenase [Casimicrobiaceae bacterium]|nr:acyl-CoA dehydrogenase [Casimicrobiaceae bacterium]